MAPMIRTPTAGAIHYGTDQNMTKSGIGGIVVGLQKSSKDTIEFSQNSSML